jgi:putative transposase
MRVDNLLCLRKRRFVCTTDSRHTYSIYPNLTTDWKPDGINQLWVADITYIRLRESFLYLAVISGCLFPAFYWLEVFGTDGSIPDHK